MNQRILPFILSFSFTLTFVAGKAQTDSLVISGRTIDSLTYLPLPFVAIQNLTSRLGTSSNENGVFTLRCSPGDTVVFRMLGYTSKKRIIVKEIPELLVLLKENPYLLKPVTIYGNFQPQGIMDWKKSVAIPKTFRNPAGPGSGYGVETFGPGIVISGLFSRFSKREKEKRELKKDRKEAAATNVYRSTITSPEVKEFFQKTFLLSETEYSKKIEQFNIAHPEVAYLTHKDEIMIMLVNFFAKKKKED